MDRWKAEQGRGREKRKIRREKSRRERVRRKKMQMREKVGKSRNTVFFQWFVAPEGRKVGSLKRRVRSQLARWEMNNCTPLWREAHFQVKMYKAHHSRTSFGSWDVEKVHAVVARSTFPSQRVQNTPGADHFWKLRCWKSARRCGAKHISKSKCTKHTTFGPLLEVEMSQKCTPLWREAHFQVKMYKTPDSDHFWSWDVEEVHAVVARSTFLSQNVQNTPFSDHFWKLRCRKIARRCGAKNICESKCTKHQIRTTFGSWDVEKVHAVVARSTFRSQNVQSTPFSDQFWKLRCRRSARRCGAKHISKSKCTKHQIRTTFGSWDVEEVHAVVARSTFLSQNVQSTPFSDQFWKLRCRKIARRCGAKNICESKCTKHQIRTTFGSWDVEKVHAVVARSTFLSQNVQNTPGSDHFWKLRCRKIARRCGAKHISKSKCTKHTTFGPLLDVQSSFRVAGTRDCAPCQKWARRKGLVAFLKTMAGVGHLKMIC